MEQIKSIEAARARDQNMREEVRKKFENDLQFSTANAKCTAAASNEPTVESLFSTIPISGNNEIGVKQVCWRTD